MTKKTNLNELTLTEARELLDSGDISAVEIAQDCLAEIEKRNKNLNALLEVYDDFIDQAKNADKILKQKGEGKLLGIPLVLKDNILREGFVASSSSLILENYKAPYSSTVTNLLKQEGAVFVGRSNMDEFAMGSSTENSAYGLTRNPLDEERVPGGSSGGSACALAANFCLSSLGSDTAGSVRLPASFCGLVGMYPTFGMVSRYGLMAMGSSLDQIGPMGKSVADVKFLSEIISQYDPMDAMSILPETRQKLKKSFGKKIGVPWKFIDQEGLSSTVKKEFSQALENLKILGYQIIDIDLPNVEISLPAYYVISPAEVSSNLARFDGIRYGKREKGRDLQEVYLNSRGLGFGKETRRRILIGTYVLSTGYHDAYYYSAQKVRQYLRTMFKKVFDEVDFIATPTSAGSAFKLGEKADPVSMYLSDIFTVPANMIGAPAISIPFGKESDGLPLGFHLMTSWGNDEHLFTIGCDLEKTTL